MDYLDSLNEPQREAVTYTEGPLMIIAGAGSGKTRVLTYRIAYLMQLGVEPFHILALTFTNKAAREMRQRIEKVVGNEARNLWMGTFHSVFSKILRIEAEKLGYTSNFTIYDTDDSKSLIKQILKELNLDDKIYKPSVVLNRISGAKNRLISWQAYLNNPIFYAEDAAEMKPEMGRIYKTYCERCFQANAMDFDDLLFNTNVLFRDHIDVLHKYQHKFRYVLIDEFQDTNLSQYLITKKLAAVNQNICVVGDDAQSIYAFRGADIQNILNFAKDYPDLKTVKLEQNYRSTKTIVHVANKVIENNKDQLKKLVWTDNEQGTHIVVLKAATDNDEGQQVAYSLFEEKMQNHYHNKDFAILYRTNYQSRAFEEALRRQGIKYKVYGGLSFYQRKEIKDLLAYLRFVINPKDEEAFRRIINLPKRGIGDTTVQKIVIAAHENNLSLWEVVSEASKYLGKGRSISPIEDFALMIKEFQIVVEKKDAFEATSHIAKGSGLLRELFEDKTVEGRARYENVQELLNAVKEFVDNPEKEDKSLIAFLQEVALITTADENESKDGDDDYVSLMTIHSAKGLEFKVVYIVGLEEDLFPSQMMLSSRADLEEERRLFYVAITRAEKKLFISYALQRYRFGNLRMCEPSRFIDEIDVQYLTTKNNRFSTLKGEDTLTNFGKPLVRKADDFSPSKPSIKTYPLQNQKNPQREHTPSANFVASNPAKLREGMKVEHQKFGFGRVLKIDNQGTDKRATILFDNAGEKTLLLSFAKLMIIE
ncbi:ATP-dependent helicase [Thermoflexibacter ruber]|uniref:DNA 3'-5' helicase n=1 Tax=Thermoflexibacter ruber TaxID=1003 RepID=A0A1I2CMC5_9BACT|nr:UvrD-helicase domain-containing protein [Thermoflexibacter ruber]SFE69262.1 DNA helicase-2 / ATP-dependent DNA helicase PcrA [Thermoflexibacter ruber]